MTAGGADLMEAALAQMEAALDLLDRCDPPIGSAEYLDLAISTLAPAVDATGETRLRQLRRTQSLGDITEA